MMKPEELSILSCEKGPRPKAEAFFTAKNGELRGFKWLKTQPTMIRIPHNQQIGHTWLIIVP